MPLMEPRKTQLMSVSQLYKNQLMASLPHHPTRRPTKVSKRSQMDSRPVYWLKAQNLFPSMATVDHQLTLQIQKLLHNSHVPRELAVVKQSLQEQVKRQLSTHVKRMELHLTSLLRCRDIHNMTVLLTGFSNAQKLKY